MKDTIGITLTSPGTDGAIIEFRRHFAVEGRFTGDVPIPKDAKLTVYLTDAGGNRVRTVSCERKNAYTTWVDCPMLTTYPEALDPGRERLKRFGFAPLMVRDADNPEASLRDASIKCFCSDTGFKAMLVTATDRAHGLVFDDGIGYLDENGLPYTVLGEGGYTVHVALNAADGALLAYAERRITIGHNDNTAIVRFHPDAHRVRMDKWFSERGIAVLTESVPGYLEAYLGTWLYHMGLLPMYLAGDVTQYLASCAHLFVYILDPASTSYSTELAFLQEQGVIDDPKRLRAYHYDIGEARLCGREAHIVEFRRDRYFDICRVDLVDGSAGENRFELDGRAVLGTVTGLCAPVRVRAGQPFAIMGTARPWQMNPKDFVRLPSNTYEMHNALSSVRYTFSDGDTSRTEERGLLLERFENGVSIGTSVAECYNLFRFSASDIGKTIQCTARVFDRRGRTRGEGASVTFLVEA